eukprot:8287577-Pyramimonas_sp.AAC.1
MEAPTHVTTPDGESRARAAAAAGGRDADKVPDAADQPSEQPERVRPVARVPVAADHDCDGRGAHTQNRVGAGRPPLPQLPGLRSLSHLRRVGLDAARLGSAPQTMGGRAEQFDFQFLLV